MKALSGLLILASVPIALYSYVVGVLYAFQLNVFVGVISAYLWPSAVAVGLYRLIKGLYV